MRVWNPWDHETNGLQWEKHNKSCSPAPDLLTFEHFITLFFSSRLCPALFLSVIALHTPHQSLSCIVNDRETDKDQEKISRHTVPLGISSVSLEFLHFDIRQILLPPCMSSIDSLKFVIFWSLSSSKPSFFILISLFFWASSSSFHTCSYQRLSLFIISTLYLYGLTGLCSPKGICWCHCI